MNAQLNQQELMLWNASMTVTTCIENNLRDELVDYLSPEVREKLFEGYVLQEHYETLKKSLDISRLSNKLLQGAQNDYPQT